MPICLNIPHNLSNHGNRYGIICWDLYIVLEIFDFLKSKRNTLNELSWKFKNIPTNATMAAIIYITHNLWICMQNELSLLTIQLSAVLFK